MARRRRRRGTGSIITTRKLSGRGTGQLNNPNSFVGAFVPPALGGAAAGTAILLLENFSVPTNGVQTQTQAFVGRWAGTLGAVTGAFAAMMIAGLARQQAAGVGAFAGAIGVAGFLGTKRWMNKDRIANGALLPEQIDAGNDNAMSGLRGRRLGAIVPQVQPRALQGRQGTGAIVLEPAAGNGLGDPRGETVSLGNVNPGAFGTPGFRI